MVPVLLPRVEDAKVDCASNVAQEVLDSIDMFLSWRFHEPAYIAHNEGDVCPSVHKV